MKTIEQIIQSIKNSSKTLWILCGLPYSGKTYFAEKILAKTFCVYISIDHILKERGYDWNSNKLPDEEGWRQVFDISYRKSQEALKSDANVLYDSTNHTQASRDALRKVAHDVGADARVIYIDIPVELVRKRWEENKKAKSRFVLDEKLLNMTIDSLEVPTDDEDVFTLQNT